MACHQAGAMPLKQCWNIVNWTPGNRIQWNLNRNSYIFIQENALENVVWKMAAILSRPQCVNFGHGWVITSHRKLLLLSHNQELSIKINRTSHPGGPILVAITGTNHNQIGMLSFNSLWPSGTIWSTLAQVIAWWLTAPSHYLNQCWLPINKILWDSFQGNVPLNT